MLYDVMMVSAQQCVSAVYIHIHSPSWVSLPSSPSHPLGHQRTQSWASCTIQHFPLASYFTHGSVYTGNPLQCSCLENPRDRRAWWAAVYGVAQSRTRVKRLSTVAAMCIYVSATLCPTVSFPMLCPQVCCLCLHLYFCPADRFISTIRFQIYALIYDIYFSLSDLTSLCITGSRFLLTTDSNSLLFMAK